MSSAATNQPLPTLRLHIRRSIVAAAVRQNALAADTLATVATVKCENAVFQLTSGRELSGNGDVLISFPDPSTLQVAVRPGAKRVVHGLPAAVFTPSITVLKNLGVLLSSPAVALIGEMTHTRQLGELSIQVVGSSDGCVLEASCACRPFALALSGPLRPVAPTPPRDPGPSIRARFSSRPDLHAPST